MQHDAVRRGRVCRLDQVGQRVWLVSCRHPAREVNLVARPGRARHALLERDALACALDEQDAVGVQCGDRRAAVDGRALHTSVVLAGDARVCDAKLSTPKRDARMVVPH
eukprot:505989-Prymnesium_polylepis.2